MKFGGAGSRTHHTERPVDPTSSPTSADGTANSDLEMTNLDLQFQTNGVSLPTPEDFGIPSPRHVEKQQQRHQRMKLLAITGGILLAVAAIAGTSIGVVTSSKAKSQQKNDPNLPTNRISQTAPPMDAIVSWLSERNISNRPAMTTVDTPQYQAVQWLRTRQNAALPTMDGNLNFYQSNDMSAYKYAASFALAVLYYSTQRADGWVHSLDFVSNQDDVCEWVDRSFGISAQNDGPEEQDKGVLCDSVSLIPYQLAIEWNGLAGTIPTELGILTTLISLDLSRNSLTGTLPTELCQLTNLVNLEVGHNNFHGNLPDCLASKLSQLRVLNVPLAGLAGPFPDLCHFSSLQAILIQHNDFTGPLPICNTKGGGTTSEWSHMVELSLSDNLFVGTLPTQLVNLPNLTALFVDGNKLSGNPLATINQLNGLQQLYLEGNSFTGAIDGDFAANLVNLAFLDLSANNFTSTTGIPSQLLALPNLVLLDVSTNQLRGPITNTIARRDNFRFLSAYQNQLTGPVPSALTNFVNLTHLDLSSNRLTGNINGHGVFDMILLENIFLSENPGLTAGPVPEMVGMPSLREVSLKNTNRVGTLPTFINSPFLHLIDLDNNALTGTVPENYGKFTNLGFLLLNRNPGLNGTLPTFYEKSILNTVLLDRTGITGNFDSICNLNSIKGLTDIYEKLDPLVLADCGDADSGITCSCCSCCTKSQTTCSEPKVANLDWTWELKFGNFARDFGVNRTMFPSSS